MLSTEHKGEAIATLLNVLEDPHHPQRFVAAKILLTTEKKPKAIAAIREYFSESNSDITIARLLLEAGDDDKMVGFLAKALASESELKRRDAAEALSFSL